MEWWEGERWEGRLDELWGGEKTWRPTGGREIEGDEERESCREVLFWRRKKRKQERKEERKEERKQRRVVSGW